MTSRALAAGIRLAVLAVLIVLGCTAVRAQSTSPPSAPSTSIDADVLRDLPTSDDIFSLLETTEPSLISDRFSGSGLYTGQAARIGSFFSSWSQTLYRIGDITLSDPTGSGAPLMLPDLGLWQRIDITTGMMPADLNAPGVAVTLHPLRPSAKWTTTLSGAGGLPATAAAGPPPIARLNGWNRAAAITSGPLVTDAQGTARLSGVFAGSWTRGSQFARAESGAVNATIGSGFAQLLFTPSDSNEVQLIGWVQKSIVPFDERGPFAQLAATTDENASHLQASWERRRSGAPQFRAFGGYTERARTPNYTASTGAVFEDLTDGPLSQLAFTGTSVVSQWTMGVRAPAAFSSGMHAVEAGLDVGGSRDRSSSLFSGSAGELVNGIPARVWMFSAPAGPSLRRETTVNAYVTDRIALAPNLTVNAGLRLDGVWGSADGAANGVSWHSWLPRARVDWVISDKGRSTAFAGYSRAANRLPLDTLAIGDPAAPTASIVQWLAPPSAAPPLTTPGATGVPGVIVARVGPGTGGDPTFSAIDANLQRPTTDEIAVGFETHPTTALRLRVVGFVRRESDLIGLVDTGTGSAFTLTTQPDPGLQLQNPADDQLLPVFNRVPSSFGQDRYLLTNPSEDAATSKSIEVSAELTTKRLLLFGGASANQSEGPAANVGFGPLQNDQDIIGQLFVDPNAGTFARGRLFTDRAYTIKLSAVLRLPSDVHLGLIARYQDGQPFSRLVVVTGLNQGAEAIRAFPNGESRFTFAETLDARIQKGFAIGKDRFDVVFDVFNLLNTTNEVEEQTVSGSTFRAVTAVQPPRAFHAGLPDHVLAVAWPLSERLA